MKKHPFSIGVTVPCCAPECEATCTATVEFWPQGRTVVLWNSLPAGWTRETPSPMYSREEPSEYQVGYLCPKHRYLDRFRREEG
jgi:hypothetical protein